MKHHAVKAYEGFRALFHLQYSKMDVRNEQFHAPATLPSKKYLWTFWLVQDCAGFEVKPAGRRGRSLCLLVIEAIRRLCIDFLYNTFNIICGKRAEVLKNVEACNITTASVIFLRRL